MSSEMIIGFSSLAEFAEKWKSGREKFFILEPHNENEY